MVLEGDPGTIEQFIHEVCESTYGSVTSIEKVERTWTGEFSGFEIVA